MIAKKTAALGAGTMLGVLALAGAVLAQDEAPAISVELFTTNNLWMMIATGLVFIMHLGFACVESGLTRAKNTTNILFKNTFIPCLGLVTYALIGFNLMYPGEFNGWLGFAGFGLYPGEAAMTSAYNPGYTYWTDFLFQAMFAATCATIVSGAVAERINLKAFMLFSLLFVTFTYPVIGSWKWGKGWLDAYGFYDFAGSTLVHSVGGWGALASCCSGRASASTAPTGACIPCRATACRWRPSVCSCSGSAGSGSTAARSSAPIRLSCR